MDIFVEQTVQKKRTSADFVKIITCVLASVAAVIIIPLFLGSFALIICAALIYLLYNIILSVNIEYEYAFTNGALDVDKIIAARRRKNLTELNAREIEILAKTTDDSYRSYKSNSAIKRISAHSGIYGDDVYFAVFMQGDKKTMLLFNPNEEILDGFKRLNPQKVFLD